MRIIRALRDLWASLVTVPLWKRRNERAYRAYMEDQDEPGYDYEDHR